MVQDPPPESTRSYGRVSTRDQHPDAQHDTLAAARYEEIFVDKASGTAGPAPRAGQRAAGSRPDRRPTRGHQDRPARCREDPGSTSAPDQPSGKPLDPRRDLDEWKELLTEAGVREARLHDARHTAATTLLVRGVPDRTVMDTMEWSTLSMKKRYMRVTTRSGGTWPAGSTPSSGR